MLREFKDGTLTVGTSGDCDDIIGILDGGNDTGSKNNLLPDFANIDYVNSYKMRPKYTQKQKERVWMSGISAPSGRRL
jgi:hypothetical protein